MMAQLENATNYQDISDKIHYQDIQMFLLLLYLKLINYINSGANKTIWIESMQGKLLEEAAWLGPILHLIVDQSLSA